MYMAIVLKELICSAFEQVTATSNAVHRKIVLESKADIYSGISVIQIVS